MRGKKYFQLVGLSVVVLMLLSLLEVWRRSARLTEMAKPVLRPNITLVPPGSVAFQSNARNNCPDILSHPDTTHLSKMLQNRTQNSYNYYKAKHSTKDEIQDTVVILTPITDAKAFLPRFFKGLCSLDYPHDKISVVLGEDSSSNEETFKAATEGAAMIRPFFRRVDVVHLHENLDQAGGELRHVKTFQIKRRKHLARSRNKLLHAGLQDEKWVLWIDVDVVYYPVDLIQQLIAVQKHVVAASCLWIRKHRELLVYDRNTWKETERSLNYQKNLPKDQVMLEGYDKSLREYLLEYRTRGEPYVNVDGVGGSVLLVYAECHRRGLIFPPFIYDHHLETEGLAKIAKDMGYEVVGLPFLEVLHA